MTDLRIAPINLRDANDFVRRFHRHHKAAQGHKFSVSVRRGESIVGVAIAGRPVAWRLDDGSALEVYRVCTDGSPNVCSMLLGAVRRAARALGYDTVLTYTLESECGVSLRAAGFRLDGMTRGGSWGRAGRRRLDQPGLLGRKRRWVWP